MQSSGKHRGDLETTLERHGLSARYVVDSAARHMISEDDIEDSIDGFGLVELISAMNDNHHWIGRRALLAI
jgi:hypothetical protein